MGKLASPQVTRRALAAQGALAWLAASALRQTVASSHAPDVVLLPRFRSYVGVEEPLLVCLIYKLLLLGVFRNPVGSRPAEGGCCRLLLRQPLVQELSEWHLLELLLLEPTVQPLSGLGLRYPAGLSSWDLLAVLS